MGQPALFIRGRQGTESRRLSTTKRGLHRDNDRAGQETMAGLA